VLVATFGQRYARSFERASRVADYTSHEHPIDQVITASFDIKYRNRWIEFMIRENEKGGYLNKTVTLLKSIQWGCCTWENSLTKKTIVRCLVKSAFMKQREQLNSCIELQDYISALLPPAKSQERIPLNEFVVTEFVMRFQ
jgi:hypothetical protein